MWAVPSVRGAAAILNTFLFVAGACGLSAQASSLPPATAIPVYFTHTIDAGKVASGAAVTAKTLQVLHLPDGTTVPKGTTIEGHVVEARPFQFDPTPYAHQKASYLSIQFDRIDLAGHPMAVQLSARAVADYFSTGDALKPQRLDETDNVGTMKLIGGGEFSPLEHVIKDEDGDVIAYNRKHGVYARLIASEYMSHESIIRCDANDTEQSVAIYSPAACGLYGFPSLDMTKNGAGDGVIRLESRNHTIRLYAWSSALLQVLPQAEAASGTHPAE